MNLNFSSSEDDNDSKPQPKTRPNFSGSETSPNHKDQSKHKEELTEKELIQASINELLNPAIIKQLFDFFPVKLQDRLQIIQQMILILECTGTGDGKFVGEEGTDSSKFFSEYKLKGVYESHFFVALTIILSHIIDNIVDMFAGDTIIRHKLMELTELLTSSWHMTEKPEDTLAYIFEAIAGLISDQEEEQDPTVINDIRVSIQKNLGGNLKKGHIVKISNHIIEHPEFYIPFARNMIKMIIAGLLITENISNKVSKSKKYLNEQDKLRREYFFLLEVTKLISPDTKSAYDLARIQLRSIYADVTTEVLVSTASSLQGMFAAMSKDPHFDSVLCEDIDGLLGVMVFLTNYGEEKAAGHIRFTNPKIKVQRVYQKPATLEDYTNFIKAHWNAILQKAIIEKETENGITPFMHNLLKLLCAAHLTMLDAGSLHNYYQFITWNENEDGTITRDTSLIDLQYVYGSIFDDIVNKNKLVSIADVTATLQESLTLFTRARDVEQ